MTASHLQAEDNRIAGDEVSCVVECPWTGGLCVGTASGGLVLMPRSQWQEEVRVQGVATEAINSIAFSGDWIAASTRAEIVIGRRSSGADVLEGGKRIELAGAHGIVATGSSSFLAASGEDGIREIVPGPEGVSNYLYLAGNNCYKLARLGLVGDQEIFACAARRDGLLTLFHTRPGGPLGSKTHPSRGLDLIDVCSLNDPRWPLAIAAISADRTLILSRDFVHAEFTAVALGALSGKAYSVLSIHDHLSILTSRELIALPHFARRFLEGDLSGGGENTVSMEVRAVDAFALTDEFPLIVGDSYRPIPIDWLIGSPPSLASDGGALEPTIQYRRIQPGLQNPLRSDDLFDLYMPAPDFPPMTSLP